MMKYNIFILLILFSVKTSKAQEIYRTSYLKFNNKEVASVDSADFIRTIYLPENKKKVARISEIFKNGKNKLEGFINAKFLD